MALPMSKRYGEWFMESPAFSRNSFTLDSSSRLKPDVSGLMIYDPGGMRSEKFKRQFKSWQLSKFRLILIIVLIFKF